MQNSSVLSVLRRFFPILWWGLKHPTRSWAKNGSSVANKWVYNGHFLSTTPLYPDEVAQWNQLYSIHARMAQNQSKLFVPAGITALGKKVRVNLEGITHQPVESVRSLAGGVTFHLSTHAHIGFMGSTPYNAFIGQDVFAQDSQGRWLFDATAGTGNSVYNRHYVARASCWFNLRMNPQVQNSMSVGHSLEDALMLEVQLHRMPKDEKEFTLDAAPGSVTRQRADFFFWQAAQYMFPTALWRARWPMM